MSVFWESDGLQIRQGDALAELRQMPTESVQMAVTSPPYWNLRDYGTARWEGGDAECKHKQGRPGTGRADGIVDERGQRNRDGVGSMGGDCRKCGARRIDAQMGLEQTPQDYIVGMVALFAEVKRVLRQDGTAWVNMGDCYAGGRGGGWKGDEHGQQHKANIVPSGLKAKDLVGMPWRLAFALQADGWYLRSEITWAKKAPMPESVTDRPTCATEKIFLLAKSARYYYDAVAVAEPFADKRMGNPGDYAPTYSIGSGRNDAGRKNAAWLKGQDRAGRNQRNFWLLGPEPYPNAHFATFPTEIPRRAILAGTSEKGCCPVCGKAWVRVVDKSTTFESGSGKTGIVPLGKYPAGFQGGGQTMDLRMGPVSHVQTLGWRPQCDHALLRIKVGTPSTAKQAIANHLQAYPSRDIIDSDSRYVGVVHDANEELHLLRQGNSRQAGTNGAHKVLFPSLLGSEQGRAAICGSDAVQEGESTAELQGRQLHEQGIRLPEDANPSEGECQRLCLEAHPSLGSSEQPTGARGLCDTPHQRNPLGQPAGEPISYAEAQSQPSIEHQADSISAAPGRGRTAPSQSAVTDADLSDLYYPGDLSPRFSCFVESVPYPPIPCVVLDPFSGAGTSGLVTHRLGRRYVGIELSPVYCGMSRDRIIADAPLLHAVERR